MENVVKLVDVCRRYGEGENVVNALSDVNAEIGRKLEDRGRTA